MEIKSKYFLKNHLEFIYDIHVLQTPAVFVKETCDAYAICYENILVLLQKENEKYLLKQFRATDASKCSPILIVENVHTSKGEKKGNTIVISN